MLPMVLGIFLVAMDQTIVISTYALIGNQFHQLDNTTWIATGYMLSLASFQYVSFLTTYIYTSNSSFITPLDHSTVK